MGLMSRRRGRAAAVIALVCFGMLVATAFSPGSSALACTAFAVSAGPRARWRTRRPVLEVLPDREHEVVPAGDRDLEPGQRAEYLGRGPLAAVLADRDGHARAALVHHRQAGVVRETRFGVPFGLGKRDPQLQAVEPGGRPAGDSSEWAMPRPAVMRLSSPGAMSCLEPRLSRCSTVP